MTVVVPIASAVVDAAVVMVVVCLAVVAVVLGAVDVCLAVVVVLGAVVVCLAVVVDFAAVVVCLAVVVDFAAVVVCLAVVVDFAAVVVCLAAVVVATDTNDVVSAAATTGGALFCTVFCAVTALTGNCADAQILPNIMPAAINAAIFCDFIEPFLSAALSGTFAFS